MSGVHFHLVFTHAVVSTVIIGTLVLLWSVIRRNQDIRMTGLGLIVLGALLTIPVYLTGEDAEHTVEEQAQISHDVIHEHEESAETTFIAVEILGAVALGALLMGYRRKSIGTGVAVGVLVLGGVVGGMMINTANLGGEVRHTEIRSGSPGDAGGNSQADDHDDHEHEDEH